MTKKNNLEKIEKVATTLGKETEFTGTMKFTQSLKIDGKFDGIIDSTGFLYIEEGANVKADIKARSIIVGGIVHGNIEAAEKLEMLSTGKVYGNIKTAKLRIADGVVFEGKCEMIKPVSDINLFSATVENLKKSLV